MCKALAQSFNTIGKSCIIRNFPQNFGVSWGHFAKMSRISQNCRAFGGLSFVECALLGTHALPLVTPLEQGDPKIITLPSHLRAGYFRNSPFLNSLVYK
jgi:hypothetical protein